MLIDPKPPRAGNRSTASLEYQFGQDDLPLFAAKQMVVILVPIRLDQRRTAATSPRRNVVPSGGVKARERRASVRPSASRTGQRSPSRNRVTGSSGRAVAMAPSAGCPALRWPAKDSSTSFGSGGTYPNRARGRTEVSSFARRARARYRFVGGWSGTIPGEPAVVCRALHKA